jgi:hypothetical protein
MSARCPSTSTLRTQIPGRVLPWRGFPELETGAAQRVLEVRLVAKETWVHRQITVGGECRHLEVGVLAAEIHRLSAHHHQRVEMRLECAERVEQYPPRGDVQRVAVQARGDQRHGWRLQLRRAGTVAA